VREVEPVGDDYEVLFIAGSGRSGTTLLQHALGQVDGFFAAGEVRYLWDRGLVKNRMCGCRRPIRECGTWNAILERAGGLDPEEAAEIARQIETFRITQLPRTLVPALRRRELHRLGDLLGHLHRLYGAIAEVTGCRVIVDSSKNPSFGYLLAHADLPGLDVLHMVRDAPAAAFSWGKRKESEPGHQLRRRSPATAAVEWDAHNLATEVFLRGVGDRYRRVRYEDLVAEPRSTLVDLLGWLGAASVEAPFASDHELQLLHETHTVFGNDVRFLRGAVEVRRDDRWRTQMPRRDRVTVAALTWPLRRRYGYPDVGRRGGPAGLKSGRGR
jgi:hypothetical protein